MVDFPAPFAPTSPARFPLQSVKDTRSRIILSPYDLLMSCAVNTVIDAAPLAYESGFARNKKAVVQTPHDRHEPL